MKRYILVLLLFAFAYQANTQTYQFEKIEYSEDSLPILIKFKVGGNKYDQADAKIAIKECLGLSREDDLKTKKILTDDSGVTHERFQHYFKGLKVEFSEYISHSKEGKIESLSGKLKKIKSFEIQPTLNEKEALGFALKYIHAELYMWQIEEMEQKLKKDNINNYYPNGELLIWTDWKSEKAILAYKFNIYSQVPFDHYYIYVDANTGSIIDVQMILKNDAVIGSAATRYSGNVSITTDRISSGFRLVDPSRGNGIETMDMNQLAIFDSAVNFIDTDNNWSSSEWNNTQKDNAALDAHFSAQRTYDYFKQPFINRNGWDNKNSVLKLYVHFNINWNNGGWDPTAKHIILGDGDGEIFNPLTDLDVIAHEFGHGISDAEVGLNSNGEPGAIDEGLSDIWAACVEQFAAIPGNNIWIMGEDYQLDPAERRNLQNPGVSHYHENNNPANPAIPYPDTYMGTGWYNGSWDYNGRHINCMILSHWFYLLAQGGSGTNDFGNSFNVIGLGINNAAKIVYRMITGPLIANSNYSDARTYSINLAINEYGENSCQVKAVTDAWYAVGIGAPFQYSNISISGPLSVCTSGATFSVIGFPSNCIVNWSNSNNLTYISGQGTNNYQIRSNDIGDGWVRASIFSSCDTIVVTKNIIAGGFVYSDFNFRVYDSGGNYLAPSSSSYYDVLCPNTTYHINLISNRCSVTNLSWSVPSTWTVFSAYNDWIYINTNSAPGGNVRVNAYTCCNENSQVISAYFGQSSNCNYFSLTPNPASETVRVTIINYDKENAVPESENKVHTISILDTKGVLQYTEKGTGKEIILSTGKLKNGNYIVEVTDGKKVYRNQLVIKH